jgi:uncharacterized protein
MRLVYTSDLHGSIKQYESLATLITKKNADILIIGGDLFEYNRSDEKPLAFSKEYLLDYFKRLSVPVFIIGGNTDWPRPINELRGAPNLTFLTFMPIKMPDGDSYLLGYDIVNPTPFSIKVSERRDLKDDYHQHTGPIFTFDVNGRYSEKPSTYLNELSSMEEDLAIIPNPKPTIWVMHAPPFGTHLDMTKNKTHVGSIAIRSAIELKQPLLTLHGHIHESPYVTGHWLEKIGNTIAINPGRGNDLHAVILDLSKDGRIEQLQHTVFGTGKIS